jgi:uncharacterized protein (TIGR02266 family)
MGSRAKRKKQRAKRRERASSETLAVAPTLAVETVGHAATETVATTTEMHRPSSVRAKVDPTVDHRASERVSLEVELHMASDSHFFSGLSGDISEGGVFVSTYRELAVGSLVDLEFSLPGAHRTVHTRGEVRWHRDASANQTPGVGIAFEEIPDDDRALIHRFCTMRPPLYYDDVG